MLTGTNGGQAFFAYSTNYLIDVENAIIVDVEATTAIRQAEALVSKRIIERSLEQFDLYPGKLMGDSAYGSAEMLGWLVYKHGIEQHVTVFDNCLFQRNRPTTDIRFKSLIRSPHRQSAENPG